jgi:hypothetical protein
MMNIKGLVEVQVSNQKRDLPYEEKTHMHLTAQNTQGPSNHYNAPFFARAKPIRHNCMTCRQVSRTSQSMIDNYAIIRLLFSQNYKYPDGCGHPSGTNYVESDRKRNGLPEVQNR